MPALGYALVEELRLGRFDVEMARRLGVPEGPLFGRLQPRRGGRGRRAHDHAGRGGGGRRAPDARWVYTGDTRPARATAQMAMGADLLIHDATFGQEEKKRAWETRHSTAAEAARVAARAKVKRLVLTHLSARYADSPKVLEEQARAIFPASVVARDGLEIEIGYRA